MPKLNKKLLTNLSLLLNVLLIPALIFSIYNSTALTKPDPYPYLSKRIYATDQNDYLLNVVSLRDQLNKFVKENGDSSLGLYFEYLPTGTTIGVNDRTEHEFASLLKLPIVMAYYLQVAKEKMDFNQTFEIKENDLDSRFGDLYSKEAGTKMSARELIQLMLVNSDNTAANVLADNVKKEFIQYIFSNLDISLDRDSANIQTISPKKYASIYIRLAENSDFQVRDESK